MPGRKNANQTNSTSRNSAPNPGGLRRRKAVELLARRPYGKSLEDIAAELKVKPETLFGWLAEEEFRAAIVESVRNEIRSWLPVARDVLIRKALEDGDKECLKILINVAGLMEDDRPQREPLSEILNAVMSLSDDELERKARELRERSNGE